jgi:hypothetical protein
MHAGVIVVVPTTKRKKEKKKGYGTDGANEDSEKNGED